ncbi:heme exporter protein CcmB [Aestuariispira insulae]|uniref:Heme exporter protein B n=1 Tax=Aestuariispira insulae TaxID=1461337 RepID=A0A3D9HRR6_9PROT|nr:heme exporter protein CcmB [Aestuariispira insulae]RED51556.1 heme exporter protein B [Aestuariispira insulae]
MAAFFSLIRRDLQLALRQSADLAMVLAFFVIAASLFPLAVGPDKVVLGRIAAGVVWVLALLSVMMSLDRLFHNDYQDGALELIVLGPQPLILVVLGKVLAYWLSTGLPLLILAPVIAMMLNLEEAAYLPLMTGLLLGTPVLALIGAVGAALSLGARRAGLLMALLVLPLYMPVLIFGVTAIEAATTGFNWQPHMLYLGAILAAALPLAPWAAASAIRQALD